MKELILFTIYLKIRVLLVPTLLSNNDVRKFNGKNVVYWFLLWTQKKSNAECSGRPIVITKKLYDMVLVDQRLKTRKIVEVISISDGNKAVATVL